MAGRIRTIKPEWLEDEKLASCDVPSRLLSVALILLADDHGRGRGHPAWLAGQVFPMSSPQEALEMAEFGLTELSGIGFVRRYMVRGQHYFEIANWKKHQRIDKPGKARVPAPESEPDPVPEVPVRKPVYFIRGRTTGLIKIGESVDPIQRLAELSKNGSETLDLLAIIKNDSTNGSENDSTNGSENHSRTVRERFENGDRIDSGTEREVHELLSASRVHGEWFQPTPSVLKVIRLSGGDPEIPLATAGYSGSRRIRESFENGSENDSGTTSDLRPPTSDQDHDLHTSCGTGVASNVASQESDETDDIIPHETSATLGANPPPLKLVPSNGEPKPKKPPCGPHAQVVAHWCKAFENTRSRKYVFQASRDGASVKKILADAKGDVGEACRRIDAAFADTKFWSAKVTLGQIAKDPNTFATLDPPPRSVQFEPGYIANDEENRQKVEEAFGVDANPTGEF